MSVCRRALASVRSRCSGMTKLCPPCRSSLAAWMRYRVLVPPCGGRYICRTIVDEDYGGLMPKRPSNLWRIVQSVLFFVAVLVSSSIESPQASAHGTFSDPDAPIAKKFSDPFFSTSLASTAAEFGFESAHSDADQEFCPGSNAHSGPAHTGCCAGTAHCVTGCGAMIVSDAAQSLTGSKAPSVPPTQWSTASIGTGPADPPPRLI